ncbi:3-oxoacyl-ACP synthase III family protein [Lunatimonas salinarum]|uniref:3-oxoacyl-ACP synthase III family protein n=1 Tax=Lunatimonas salinarum TaxID=1774590 RepID=UPI001ADF6406|nr:ketoacyl-ACP synthase III [Lunatimonas salinarum]
MQEKKVSGVITGSGRYIPEQVVKNRDFLNHRFFNESGELIQKPVSDVVSTLQKITGIAQRCYIADDQVTSDMGYLAAEAALLDAGLDREALDYIIVAHNFGDIRKNNIRVDTCPTLAARIKHKLGIANPYTVAYDLPFGCPGWLQGMIQADYFIRSGDAKAILVIGAETLSRISDPHDIDSMIFSDGAGAVVLEARSSDQPSGILKHLTRSDTLHHAHLLEMQVSYNPDYKDDTLFLKMQGRKLYEYAIKTVPQALKDCLDRANLPLGQIKKVFIHQANEKMDQNILERLFQLYGEGKPPEGIMPMSISFLGNNSVATVPVLYDLVVKEELAGHRISPGDYLMFASVGAGMNTNVMIYRVPMPEN